MDKRVALSMDDFMDRLKSFSFPEVDLVVGISSGAAFPSQKIAEFLNLPVQYIHINFRFPDNKPKYANPILLKMANIPSQFTRVLLVDDVSVTGKTLNCALDALQDLTVFTFVLKGKADYVLFPEINTCVDWPWNPEIKD